MNKKQWITFGVGLILLGLFFGYVGSTNDCLAIQSQFLENVESSQDANMNEEFIQSIRASGDAFTISCLNNNITAQAYNTIFFTLGVLLIIMGFMEKKKKHKK